jgi:hypothetical protein
MESKAPQQAFKTVASYESNSFINIYISTGFSVFPKLAMGQKRRGTYNDLGQTVLVNTNGNIYCLVGFAYSITFDTINIFLSNPGQHWEAEILAEYSPSGDFLRFVLCKGVSGSDGFSVQSFNHDHSGNLYLTGDIGGAFLFDTLLFSGASDGFIAKFNSNLNIQSVKRASSIVYDVATDNENNLYPVGETDAPVTHIDTFTLYNSSANPYSDPRMFLSKLDSTGKCLWVRQGFGANSRLGTCEVSNNNVYLLGFIDSCSLFDTMLICPHAPRGASFLAKFASNGAINWVLSPSTADTIYYNSISTDTNGNCYLTGGFYSKMVLAGDTFQKMPGSESNDFLAKLDSLGNVLWVQILYSDALIYSLGQYTDANGYTYLVGKFSGTAILGSDTITALTSSDVFIARYSNTGAYLGVKTINDIKVYSISGDAYGNAVITGSFGPGPAYFDSITLTSRGQEDFFVAKLDAITGSSGLMKVREDNRLNIYANPNAGKFTIDLPESLAQTGSATLSIYNDAGAVLTQQTIDLSNIKLHLDLGTIGKGVYSVILSSGSKKYMGRVVIE